MNTVSDVQEVDEVSEEQREILNEISEDLESAANKVERLLEITSHPNRLLEFLKLYEEVVTAENGATDVLPRECSFDPDEELPF